MQVRVRRQPVRGVHHPEPAPLGTARQGGPLPRHPVRTQRHLQRRTVPLRARIQGRIYNRG